MIDDAAPARAGGAGRGRRPPGQRPLPPLRPLHGGRQPLGRRAHPAGRPSTWPRPAGRGRRSPPDAADRQTWATAGLAADERGRGGRHHRRAGRRRRPASTSSSGQLDELAAVLDDAGVVDQRRAVRRHGARDPRRRRRRPPLAPCGPTAASAVIRLGHLSPAAAVIEAWSRAGRGSGRRRGRRRRRHGRDRRRPDPHRRHDAAQPAGRGRGGAPATPTARGEDLQRARADVDERGERFWLPELLRLQAELAAPRARRRPRSPPCSTRPSPWPRPRASRRSAARARSRPATDSTTLSAGTCKARAHASDPALALPGQVHAGRAARGGRHRRPGHHGDRQWARRRPRDGQGADRPARAPAALRLRPPGRRRRRARWCCPTAR